MTNLREQTALSGLVHLDAKSTGTLSGDLQRLLRAIRSHLEMEVAFVSEFKDGQRVFRSVDSSGGNPPVRAGMGDPLEASYCQSVVDGRLPELIPDTADVPETQKFAATRAVPVGAHLSVPIRLGDGRVYGTLCCFSTIPDHSLNERDIKLMRVFSEIIAHRIDEETAAGRLRQDMEQRIKTALDGDALSIVYQPIFDLPRAMVSGFESLSRFAITPIRTPDAWFSEAAAVGRGGELELKAVEKALEGFRTLPADVYVAVNLSPDSVIQGGLERILQGAPIPRVVLELTEHAVVSQYVDLARALAPWRERGIRVAVDDAGAGFASFRHILNLKPDLIKLDIGLTRDIDKDPARLALATALVAFGRATGSGIVAEGVETAAELKVLRSLGVANAQGYYIGRPVSLSSAVEFCDPRRPLQSGFSD